MKNNKKESINICFACYDNYAQHTGVVISSVLQNYKGNFTLNFFVVYSYISPENIKKLKKVAETEISHIEFVLVDREKFASLCGSANERFLPECFLKLKMADFLEGVDRVIFLDSDIVVIGNIAELWNIDIEGYSIGAVRDFANLRHLADITGGHEYFNSGILLINLKKWREENTEERLFSFLKEYPDRMVWNDQDLLNGVLYNEVKYLDEGWNFQYNVDNPEVEKKISSTKINLIHFVTRNKPWNAAHFSYKFRDKYLYYLFQTPWRQNVVSVYFTIWEKRLFREYFVRKEQKKQLIRLRELAKGKKVVFWGASNYLKSFIQNCKLKDDNILGIVDANSEKAGQSFGGYKIFRADCLCGLKPDLVISSVVNHPKMKNTISHELKQREISSEVVDDLFYLID